MPIRGTTITSGAPPPVCSTIWSKCWAPLMKPDLQRLPQPWMTDGPAATVMRALTADGDQARFVGGCVRDALIGRPIRDVDIATPLSPQRVTALLEKAGLKAVPTGIEHGTITAVADKTGV